MLDIDRFIARNQPTWDRLEALTDAAERGPRRMAPGEVDELVQLYQQVSGHLALRPHRLRRPGPPRPPQPDRRRRQRRHLRPAGADGRLDRPLLHGDVPRHRLDLPLGDRRGGRLPARSGDRRRRLAGELGRPPSTSPSRRATAGGATSPSEFEDYYSPAPAEDFASQVTINNIQVSVYAFALGALATLPGAALLAFNGVNLGAAGGVFADAGQLGKFFGLIDPARSARAHRRRHHRRCRAAHRMGDARPRRPDAAATPSPRRAGGRSSSCSAVSCCSSSPASSRASSRRRRCRPARGSPSACSPKRVRSSGRRTGRRPKSSRARGDRRGRTTAPVRSEAAGRLGVEVGVGEGGGELARRGVDDDRAEGPQRARSPGPERRGPRRPPPSGTRPRRRRRRRAPRRRRRDPARLRRPRGGGGRRAAGPAAATPRRPAPPGRSAPRASTGAGSAPRSW